MFRLPLLLCFVLFIGCQSSQQKKATPRADSRLLIEENKDLLRQILVVSFPLGAGSIPKEKQGVTKIFSELIKEGPASEDAASFRKKLFKLNASFNLSSGPESTILVVRAPQDKLEEALALALGSLRDPKISTDYEKIKAKVLNNRRLMNEDMQSVILYAARRDLFDYHPRTLDGTGSPKSISNISAEDVEAFSQRLEKSKPFFIVTAGPTPGQDIKTLVRKRLASPDSFEEITLAELPVQQAKTKDLELVIINKTGVTDNQVLFIQPHNIPEDSQQYIDGELTHLLLGGGSGHLNEELRVKRGLTYGVFSGINGVRKRWVVYSFASNDKLAELLKQIRPAVEGFRSKSVSADELKNAQAKLISSYRQSRELPQDELMAKMNYYTYGLDPEFMEAYEDHVNAVSTKAVHSFAKSSIDLSKGRLYLMGDEAVIKRSLKELGWTQEPRVLELDEIL